MPAPKRINKQIYDDVEVWASEGHTQAWIAIQLGWHVDTLRKLFKKDDRLRTAWDKGLALERDQLFLAIRTKAMGGSMPHAAAFARERYGDELNPQRNEKGSGAGVTIIVNHHLLGVQDGSEIKEINVIEHEYTHASPQVSDRLPIDTE